LSKLAKSTQRTTSWESNIEKLGNKLLDEARSDMGTIGISRRSISEQDQ
jgi:hypothetical protein